MRFGLSYSAVSSCVSPTKHTVKLDGKVHLVSVKPHKLELHCFTPLLPKTPCLFVPRQLGLNKLHEIFQLNVLFHHSFGLKKLSTNVTALLVICLQWKTGRQFAVLTLGVF